ncbi:MAG: DUF1476 domain-containing protein [Deltaproteobacteria bacterium]|nr:DUF1476 domain-containing protein [Deltaproteobacteria bacterium]
MTTFDERENAFENMYAHDAEMQFRAMARRNKLLGQWAAARMGLSGDAVDAYARSVVAEDLKEAGDDDVDRAVGVDRRQRQRRRSARSEARARSQA